MYAEEINLISLIKASELALLDSYLRYHSTSAEREMLQPDSQNNFPLMIAAQRSTPRIVETLLNFSLEKTILSDILNHTNVDGLDALSCAAIRNRSEIIKMLLTKSTEHSFINHQNHWGQTPLMLAIQYQAFDAINALLKCQLLDLTLTDNNGHSALFYAMNHLNPQGVKTILSHATKRELSLLLDKKCTHDQTILEIAFFNHKPGIFSLLLQGMTEKNLLTPGFINSIHHPYIALSAAIFSYDKRKDSVEPLILKAITPEKIKFLMVTALEYEQYRLVEFLLQYLEKNNLFFYLLEEQDCSFFELLNLLAEKNVFMMNMFFLAMERIKEKDSKVVSHDAFTRNLLATLVISMNKKNKSAVEYLLRFIERNELFSELTQEKIEPNLSFLQLSCKTQSIDIIQLLLRQIENHFSSPEEHHHYLFSALLFAVHKNLPKSVYAIIQYAKEKNKLKEILNCLQGTESPLNVAADKNYYQIVAILMENEAYLDSEEAYELAKRKGFTEISHCIGSMIYIREWLDNITSPTKASSEASFFEASSAKIASEVSSIGSTSFFFRRSPSYASSQEADMIFIHH